MHKFNEENPERWLGENNPSFGRKWINDGKNNKSVKKEDVEKYLKEGWKLGMKRPNCMYKKPDGTYIVMDNSNGNKHNDWINCGVVEEIWYI